MRSAPLLIFSVLLSSTMAAEEGLPNGAIFARSFVDQSQIVSNYKVEQYAHQSSLRIVSGVGYAAYQCNETTPEENKAGQVVRLAIFDIVNPTATARWVDIARGGEAPLGGTFAASPMLHVIGGDTLRVFFNGHLGGDPISLFRTFYRDLTLSSGALSQVKQARCTISKDPEIIDLAQPTVQKHLDFLFGEGFGAQFATGITNTCDFHLIGGRLYSTIQIKNSVDGKTLLMTNILMRSTDDGATWELLGAPDPRQVPGEIKILAEPALTHDGKNIYLHLRSNVVENGYMLSKTALSDLYTFTTPVKKWTYGIGRPAVCDFGKPIGMVGLFTAHSVPLGGEAVTRNKVDVVMIDRGYGKYARAFSVVDYNAVNTPFMHLYRDEIYVTYSTGKRRLMPKFATSEVVFSKLRREFFVPTD